MDTSLALLPDREQLNVDQAVRLKPDYAESYFNRALAKTALGRNIEARVDFETALNLAQKAGDDSLKAHVERRIQKLNQDARTP